MILTACSPTDILTVGVPGDFTTITDVSYQPGERHTLDIYKPTTPTVGHPVIVFFYGGAWQHGKKEQFKFIAEQLAANGITVVVPDYRLAPQVAFPAFINDGAEAVAWTQHNIASYGGDSKNLFVMGHSAGGYIAAMLALNPEYLAKVGMKPGDLAGMIGLAGPYNFLPITWPDLKPIFEIVPDLSQTQPITFVDGKNPPLLLMAGSADTTVDPIKNTDTLYHKVNGDRGVAEEKLYPGVGHIGMVTAFSPIFGPDAPVLNDTLTFVKAHTGTD